MKQTLTITIFVSYTFPFIGSGIGNVAYAQAEKLAQMGHKVSIVSSNVPVTKPEFVKHKVRFIKLRAFNFLYRFDVPVPFSLFNNKTIEVIKNSDVIHIHDILYPSSFLAVYYAKRYKKPVILTQHIPFITYKNPLFNLLQRIVFHTFGRYILKNSTRIIYFNSEVGDWLHEYTEKLEYLPNGVDLDYFQPVSIKQKVLLRKKYSLDPNKSIILFVGRLVAKKGYKLVYGAASVTNTTLFVGGGKAPTNTNNMHIRFLGPKTRSQLREIYQLSDILVLPSHSEGFPLCVQEAMSSGLAIIVSDLECYKKLRLDETLFAMISPRIDTIQQTIRTITTNVKKLRAMQKYSRSKAKQYYSWNKHTSVLQHMYREVSL